jgi:hypothetical protein
MDKDAFLKVRLPERSVEIEGVGTVRVRGLSRVEALDVRNTGGDVDRAEKKIIFYGLVDPTLTEEEVTAWYAAAPAGEIDQLVNPIVELSGLAEGAAKSGVPEVRREPR